MRNVKVYEDNDECWCGSKLAYSSCHKEFDIKCEEKRKAGYMVPPRSMIKNKAQIDGIREAGKINNGMLDFLGEKVHARMTTEELDRLTCLYLKEHGAESADYHYEGYPKHVCISKNEVVCHGVPSNYVILNEGDIVNVDTTLVYKGYYADASRMYSIGNVKPNAEKLVRVTKECLELAIKAIKPWESTLNDLGKAIYMHATKNGYTVVQEYCGHGVGLKMHENPYVLHYPVKEKTYLIVPGMVFTIEPMINEGKRDIVLDPKDGWTVYTRDRKLSAQWENTLVVTEDGVEILSK